MKSLNTTSAALTTALKSVNTLIGYALVDPTTKGVACAGDAAIIFGQHDEAAIHQINYRVPPSYEIQEANFWDLIQVLMTGARYALNSTAAVAWNKALVENKDVLAAMPKLKLPNIQPKPNSMAILSFNVPRMSPSEAKAYFNRVETFKSETLRQMEAFKSEQSLSE